MTDLDIIKHYNFHKYDKHIYWSKYSEYLSNRFNDTINIGEAAYRICNCIETCPKCVIYGNNATFKKFAQGYKDTCNDIQCINKNRKDKIQQYNLLHYGVKHTFQRKDTKDNIYQTKLKLHGNGFWSNPEKTSISLKSRSNEEINKTLLKTKTTLFNKYGEAVDNVFQLTYVKNKIKSTCLEKFGSEYYLISNDCIEKSKIYALENFGVDKYQKSVEFKRHMSYVLSLPETQNKRINTCIKRYGVNNVMLIDNIKSKKLNSEILNMSFNHSHDEDKIYDLLINKFNVVQRQYKSEQYPFACDFYIPELDLYIECQFSQYHRMRPYTGNKEDLIELEELKQKSVKRKLETGKDKSQYDNIIYTWTDLDVRKRNIAKQNNLNYLEFFNMKEFNKWFETV